jgi:hypothetical protein
MTMTGNAALTPENLDLYMQKRELSGIGGNPT